MAEGELSGVEKEAGGGASVKAVAKYGDVQTVAVSCMDAELMSATG